jgi:competence ComEA-like helix-hairpin-helix protein
MRGLLTKDERAVVFFLTASLVVGSLVLAARRVDPALVPSARPGTADSTVWEPAVEEWPVDINAGGVDDLIRLPGIGPVKAEAIVRARSERGAFASVDDLLEVKGIGPKTLAGLRPFAVASGPPAPADAQRDTGSREPPAGGEHTP